MTNLAEATPAIRLSMEQQHAIEMCCDRSNLVVGITGGAGTGKTLVLGHAYRELKTKQLRITLCAPTGRAAKRIHELTGIEAKTIHRLLEFPMPDEYSDGPNEPRRNLQNPLNEHIVFVDESSMVSPTLYRQLMNALGRHCVIRFFGDNNQLPPVEEGKPPFIEVLERYPMIELTFNYRSDDAIVSNALRVLQGRIPIRNDRFEIIYTDDPIRELLRFVTPEFSQDDHQIIMPTRKGKYGTMRINPSLQTRFNKHGTMLRLTRFDEKEAPLGIRAGDKFLWIKNDYQLNLFNGAIGRIDWLDADEGVIGLLIDGQEVIVPARLKTFSAYAGTVINYDPRKQIELGYAITTHKAQGSEFDCVVYCISRGQAFLLNRRNTYTAITRAKKHVIVISDRRAMGLSLRRAPGV